MTDFVHRQIDTAHTVGETLKDERQKKGVTLEQAEEETKVRIKYLEALERDNHLALPETVYAAGFLAKYADFLELDRNNLIDQFKRERGVDRSLSKLAPERRIKEPLFSITPKFILLTTIILVLAGLVIYISYSINQFASPPNLQISSPSTEQVITQDKTEIAGKTDEGVTLMINNQSILMDNKGNFKQEVKLTPGLNTFELRAINQLKKETVKKVQILAEF